MKVRAFHAERVEIDSKRSFEELAATTIEAQVQSMAGDLGFMILGKVDQGPLVSLLGKTKKMTTHTGAAKNFSSSA